MLAVSSPHRDEQFQYLTAQKQGFLERGSPIVSMDTKKRELIGCFKNPGKVWSREPYRVKVHDFRSQAEGIAIPYGVYDVVRNEGYVLIGTSHDTAEFAVATLLRWWQQYGCVQYPATTDLLILADGGGSNGYRPHLWKYALQHSFVNRTGLAVTVCHYPTGASKWNPADHRLFGPISCNWAGYPLISYSSMLNRIKATTTEQGLIVHAEITDKLYQTKIKISDEQMEALNLDKHATLPEWNYTIKPFPS